MRCLHIQKAFYSGYCKKHGIKFQVVVLPNGMIACVFGGSLCHNDIGMLNMSGLVDYLTEILDYVDPELGTMPGLYVVMSVELLTVILKEMMDMDANASNIIFRQGHVNESICEVEILIIS